MVQRRRRRKWLSSIIILVLVVLAGVVCYFVWDGYFRDKQPEDKPEDIVTKTVKDKEQDKTDISPKKETETVDNEEQKPEEKDLPGYDGDDPNVNETLTGVVTYAGVVDNTLMIRVNIDQYLGGGECKLELKKQDEVLYTDSAQIVGSASTASCDGFNVLTELLSEGHYDISIKLNSDDKNGTINGGVEI